ncbi:MAG: hypothetical protein IPM79_12485 [Polyangiaceae bacterium]|nr:hypothetical protein [Polyangiaceae bacterium]
MPLPSLAVLRQHLEHFGCPWKEEMVEVSRGKHRLGVFVTRKVGDRTRKYPPFFADAIDVPIPTRFIEALCRALDLDPGAVIAGSPKPN